MSQIYLLGEEKSQTVFMTQAKHLYLSDFNRKAVSYLESGGKRFYYVSTTHGIIEPDSLMDPYPVKVLETKNMDLWALYTSLLIEKVAIDVDKISIWYSGQGTMSKLENKLRKKFTVETPIKNFTSNELKMRWLDSIIVSDIEYRLGRS